MERADELGDEMYYQSLMYVGIPLYYIKLPVQMMSFEQRKESGVFELGPEMTRVIAR